MSALPHREASLWLTAVRWWPNHDGQLKLSGSFYESLPKDKPAAALTFQDVKGAVVGAGIDNDSTADVLATYIDRRRVERVRVQNLIARIDDQVREMRSNIVVLGQAMDGAVEGQQALLHHLAELEQHYESWYQNADGRQAEPELRQAPFEVASVYPPPSAPVASVATWYDELLRRLEGLYANAAERRLALARAIKAAAPFDAEQSPVAVVEAAASLDDSLRAVTTLEDQIVRRALAVAGRDGKPAEEFPRYEPVAKLEAWRLLAPHRPYPRSDSETPSLLSLLSASTPMVRSRQLQNSETEEHAGSAACGERTSRTFIFGADRLSAATTRLRYAEEVMGLHPLSGEAKGPRQALVARGVEDFVSTLKKHAMCEALRSHVSLAVTTLTSNVDISISEEGITPEPNDDLQDSFRQSRGGVWCAAAEPACCPP